MATLESVELRSRQGLTVVPPEAGIEDGNLTAQGTNIVRFPSQQPKLPSDTEHLHLDLFRSDGLEHAMENPVLSRLAGLSGKALIDIYTRPFRRRLNPDTVKRVEQRVRKYVPQAVAREFNLSETDSPTKYVRGQFDQATQIVQSFYSAVLPPDQQTVIGLQNEVTSSTGDPVRIIRRATSSAPRLRKGIFRHTLVAITAGKYETAFRDGEFKERLDRLSDLLNDQLYAGEPGEGKVFNRYSLHDNNTNTVLDVRSEPAGRAPENTHWKRHPRFMRFIPTIGYVMSDLREKPIQSAVIKSFREAQEAEQDAGTDRKTAGYIKPEIVPDNMGLILVVKDTLSFTDPKLKALRKKVTKLLWKNSGSEELGVIKSITNADRTKAKRNQSTNLLFPRILVRFAALTDSEKRDVPGVLEVIFMDEKTYGNYRQEVGNKNPQSGRYDGGAHPIYEAQRVWDFMDDFTFPETFDKPEDRLNVESAVHDHINSIAEKLRQDNRVR